ncbi:MAG: relaxase/mobilization nuclease domain-containing protein [Butyricicoccus pullicaecorum]
MPKTLIKPKISNSKLDLYQVLHYAVDENKTKFERQYYVTGINCAVETADQKMQITKERFGKTGGTPCPSRLSELQTQRASPKACHAIGVKLAQNIGRQV